MRSVAILVLAAQAGRSVVAFAPSAPLRLVSTSSRASSTLDMAYIPDGLSPAEWKKLQAEEKKKRENLGKVGPQRFKSRSFQAWQESGAGHLFPVNPQKAERPGRAHQYHFFKRATRGPSRADGILEAQLSGKWEKFLDVKKGEIPMDKVPYMQRGGAWDDSDLTKKGAEAMAKRKDKMIRTDVTSKKVVPKKWSQTDKAYANGGYVKEQSVSIFGGTPLPWNINKDTPGVETNNNRTIGKQKKVTRPGTELPMSPAVKARIEKEAAEERKRQEMLKAQLKSEKKGLFGLW